MLEEQLKELIEKFGLKDEKAITFGHPKMKMKWILPLPGITVIHLNNSSLSLYILMKME